MDTHNVPPHNSLRLAIVFGLLAAFCFGAAIQANCEPRKDTPIKLALAHYVAMAAVDAAQTTRCVQASRCTEQNPALAPMVGHPATFLAVRAGVTTAAAVGLWKARGAHPTLTKWLAVSLAAGQTVVVVSNYRQLRRTNR